MRPFGLVSMAASFWKIYYTAEWLYDPVLYQKVVLV